MTVPARSLQLCLVAWVLGAAPVVVAQPNPQPSSQPSVEEAGRHFARGVELFRAGSYREALEAFRQAHRIAPNFRVLFNIGSTSLLIGDYVSARAAFRRYLSAGKTAVSAARRQQVEGHLARLEQKIAWLRITTNITGADVRIDGRQVGTTPLAGPIAVNPGPHEVVATRDPAPPASQQLSVAPGERHAVRLVIVELPAVGAGRPVAKRGRSYTKFWITAGATGLLAAGTVVLGVLALSARSDLEDELAQYPASPPAIEDARDRVDRYALGTDLLLGASAIAAGLSAYFLISELRGGDEGGDTQRSAVHLGPGFASFRTTF